MGIGMVLVEGMEGWEMVWFKGCRVRERGWRRRRGKGTGKHGERVEGEDDVPIVDYGEAGDQALKVVHCCDSLS